MSHPKAWAFYPPQLHWNASSGQPSNNGLHELAASRWHSPIVTNRLVVSYTTFSPLLLARNPFKKRAASKSGYFLLSFPTVTNSFYIRKWSVLRCPDFPLIHECISGKAGALLSRCKGIKKKRAKNKSLLIICDEGMKKDWLSRDNQSHFLTLII